MFIEQTKTRRTTPNPKRIIVFLFIWGSLCTLCVAVVLQMATPTTVQKILAFLAIVVAVVFSAVVASFAASLLIQGDNFEQAQAHWGRKKYRESRDAFLRYAQDDPEYAAESYYLAARAAIRANVLDEPILVAPGASIVARGDKEGAIRYYRQALTIDPQHYRAMLDLAKLLPKNDPERFELLRKAVDIRPRYKVFLQLAAYYRKQGDFNRAFDCLESACKYDPNRKDAYKAIISLCKQFNKLEEADRYRKSLRERNTGNYV